MREFMANREPCPRKGLSAIRTIYGFNNVFELSDETQKVLFRLEQQEQAASAVRADSGTESGTQSLPNADKACKTWTSAASDGEGIISFKLKLNERLDVLACGNGMNL